MTDCITAEKYKPENVEHTEQDASYKDPILFPTISLTAQLIVVTK